jgi:hypothetical protein
VKNRFRQRPTTSRRLSRRAAISSLFNPSAANRIILARWTRKYGNVYLPARRRNSASSADERRIGKGFVVA